MSDESKRRQYHQSEINTFLKCGLQWKFRFVDGIKTPPSAAATVGSVVDAGASHNFKQKVESGVDVPLEEVLEVASGEFDKRSPETQWDPEEKPGDMKDAAISVMRLHHLKVAPEIQPATVQEKFVIETDAGYNLGGTIDYTEKSGVIGDGKVASRQNAAGYAVNRALQPAMYDYAYRAIHKKVPLGFRFDVITKPTVRLGAEYKPIFGNVDRKDHEWLFQTIGVVDKAIAAGVALPAPEGAWWCSKDWCGYWSICKGRK